MANNVTAEIVAIGTEILLGEITDTNSVYIARQLRDLGINLYFMTTVGDNEARIASALQIAMSRADIVITCGGLGPTIDDMTRQAVALASNRELVFHQTLLDQIAARFANFRATMTENNRRQAYLPTNAELVENPVGTAPSFIVEDNGCIIISLPGVPREMTYLMENAIIPRLRERYALGIIKARVLKTAGIGESMLDDLLGTELLEHGNPSIGLAAHSGQVDVRITAKATDEAEADVLIAPFEARVRDKIGSFIFGVDEDTIESAFSARLMEKQASLVLYEAGIESGIAERLTAIDHIASAIRAHRSFGAPNDLLATVGEKDFTSLRSLAELTATTLAASFNASVVIVLAALPETPGDQADAEEASALAVYVNGQLRSRAYGFGGNSEMAQKWMSTWALSMAWQMLGES
jgi:nicotinamide-nucleotide amidase